MKKLHTYDWMLITIFILLISCGFLSVKLIKRNDELNHSRDSTLYKIEEAITTEKFLNRIIESQQKSIYYIKSKNDSLDDINKDINNKRKINYKLYLNEKQRNISNDSVSIIIDSILRSNNIRH